jgi:hypothetical protein
MDIDSMLDRLYDTVKDANMPLVLGLVHEGEVKALVSGNGKELSLIIGSMIQNISHTTGIPTSIILIGILQFLKMDEGSEEIDG